MVTVVNLTDKLHTDLDTDLFYKRLISIANIEICYLVKSFAGATCGFSYGEDQVVPLRDC